MRYFNQAKPDFSNCILTNRKELCEQRRRKLLSTLNRDIAPEDSAIERQTELIYFNSFYNCHFNRCCNDEYCGRDCGVIGFEGMFSNVAGKLIRSGDGLNEFENKMYRWNETRAGNSRRGSVAKGPSRRPSVEGIANVSMRSSGRSNSRRDLREYIVDDDVEAQVLPRFRRESKRSSRGKEDFFSGHYQNSPEKCTRHMEDEVLVNDTRISDIRENWRMRVMKENAEKQSQPKKKEESRRRSTEKKIEEDYRSKTPTAVSSNWNYQPNRNEDLQRSKSTPDVTEALQKGKEEWFPDDRRKNGSMMDIYTRNWGGKSCRGYPTTAVGVVISKSPILGYPLSRC